MKLRTKLIIMLGTVTALRRVRVELFHVPGGEKTVFWRPRPRN